MTSTLPLDREAALLVETAARLAALSIARRAFEDRLAPDFSAFDFIANDELTLSRILGWLLDPSGSHGQGAKFLDTFVSNILPDLSGFETDAAKVKLEAHCGDRRRIDLLVQSGNVAFAIENKPYAADQDGQLAHYLAWLDRFTDGRLVYLAGRSDRLPGPNSLSETDQLASLKSRRLITMGYPDLRPWLTACLGVCSAERVRAFIDDFQRLILKRFEGVQDMTEQTLLTELMTGDPGRVEAAAKIALGWRSAQVELVNRLNGQIAEALPEGWRVTGALSAKKYSQLNITSPERADLGFRIIFDAVNYNEFAFGIVRPRGSKADRQTLHDRIAASDFGPGDSNAPVDEWVWWDYPGPEYLHLPITGWWQSAVEPWVAISNGTLAPALLSFAQKLMAISGD